MGVMPTVIRDTPGCDPYAWAQPHRRCGAAVGDGEDLMRCVTDGSSGPAGAMPLGQDAATAGAPRCAAPEDVPPPPLTQSTRTRAGAPLTQATVILRALSKVGE